MQFNGRKACLKTHFEAYQRRHAENLCLKLDHVFHVRENAGHKSSDTKYHFVENLSSCIEIGDRNKIQRIHYWFTAISKHTEKRFVRTNGAIHILQPLVISDKLEMQPETISTFTEWSMCQCTIRIEMMIRCSWSVWGSSVQSERVRAINFYYFMSLDVQWILIDEFNWAAAWQQTSILFV